MRKKIFKNLSIYKQNNLKETFIKQGLWGLKATRHGILTSKQLESARKVITRLTKKGCKIWIRVACLTPKTKKAIGSRMGKGVGTFYRYICNVKQGTVIMEVFSNNVLTDQFVKKALIGASKKLSIPSRLYIKLL